MTSELDIEPWVLFGELADAGDTERIRDEAKRLGSREVARAMSRIDTGQQVAVLKALTPRSAADLLGEIAEEQAADLLENLSPEEAAPIFDEMMSNTMADLLVRLQGRQAEQVLREMDPEAAADARLLVQYAPDVAGGLMIREYLAYPVTYTTQQVIDDMRRNSEKYSEYSIQYSFVLDAEDRLVGVLPLRDLLLTPDNTPIERLMVRNPVALHDTATLDDLDAFFQEHAFLGVPVLDAQDRLIGVVRRTDVQEALGKRADRAYLRSKGIMGGEELRSMPTLTRSGRRLSWLSINIVLNMFAASVISAFQGTLEQVIALAVFLPIISDMSGCSGNQAVAVSMRELSLGLVKPFEMMHVWLKEASVGILNGIALGFIVAAVAWIWKGNPYLGLVVGVALCLNTLIAVSFGGLLPLVMKRMKVDPALASGPLLTTVTDMCGFFLVLGIATLMLPLIK